MTAAATASLLAQLVGRELRDRYRGSLLGFAWALVLPLSMLAVYTFVFGWVFRARWPGAEGGTLDFALFLFCGLVPYTFVADVLGRAPTLLLQHATLVKKVAFPLPLLVAAQTIAAAVHMAIGVGLVIGAAGLSGRGVSLWAFAGIGAVLPLLPLAFGLALILASSAVYFRDLLQIVPALLPPLMFLSPVFYPVEAVPVPLAHWITLNPLTAVIESVRMLVLGTPASVNWWMSLAVGVALAVLGLIWFRRLRPGFADLI